MAGDNSISWLMFFTFGATIFIIAGGFIYFLRRRSNRAIASDALVGHGTSRTPLSDGALPDLLSIVVFAFIAMGMLTVGYTSKSQNELNKPMPPVGGQMPTDQK